MDERAKAPIVLDYAKHAQRGPPTQGMLVIGVAVLALVVLGFSLLVPRFGPRNLAKVEAAQAMVGPNGTITMALGSFRYQLIAYPEIFADLCVLPPAIDREDVRWYPFLSDCSFIDPWGNPLVYRRVGDSYDLISCGPDRKLGTADDVTNRRR